MDKEKDGDRNKLIHFSFILEKVFRIFVCFCFMNTDFPPPPPNTHTHTHTGTHWSWYSGASHCPLMELNFPPCLTLLPAVTLGGASRCARRRSGLTPVHCRSWVCCAWQWVLGVAAASVAAPGTELLGTGPHRGCLLVPESRTCPWLWREQWEPLRRSKHRNSISPNSHGWWGPARFVWQ